MEQIWGELDFYHRLFVLCLAGAAVLLTASIVLFIRLDIRNALGFLSGYRERQEIRKIERENRGEEATEFLTANLEKERR